jgi:hypothetical protein
VAAADDIGVAFSPRQRPVEPTERSVAGHLRAGTRVELDEGRGQDKIPFEA